MCHNYWSPHTPEPVLGNKEAIAMRSLHTATGEEPPLATTREKRGNEDPARQKINETNISSVQSLSRIQLWDSMTAASQASLSITNSQSLFKLMSIKLVMPSNHLILCHPLLLPPQSFPASGSFLMIPFFASGGQSIGVSASASVLPVNIQDWFPLGWTGWISLQSKELSRVFFNTTVQKHPFNLKTFIIQKLHPCFVEN